MINNASYNTFSEYPEILNAKMIAKILDLGYAKTLKLIKYGGIKHIRIGNTYRIPKKMFLEWLYSNETREIVLD